MRVSTQNYAKNETFLSTILRLFLHLKKRCDDFIGLLNRFQPTTYHEKTNWGTKCNRNTETMNIIIRNRLEMADVEYFVLDKKWYIPPSFFTNTLLAYYRIYVSDLRVHNKTIEIYWDVDEGVLRKLMTSAFCDFTKR